ncbi:MAG: radical SAM protein [Candidatus Aenigmarchaeota archaeon]|nr:radical SAM protein [Candidatus Aenigmarchaeota archaeon]
MKVGKYIDFDKLSGAYNSGIIEFLKLALYKPRSELRGVSLLFDEGSAHRYLVYCHDDPSFWKAPKRQTIDYSLSRSYNQAGFSVDTVATSFGEFERDVNRTKPSVVVLPINDLKLNEEALISLKKEHGFATVVIDKAERHFRFPSDYLVTSWNEPNLCKELEQKTLAQHPIANCVIWDRQHPTDFFFEFKEVVAQIDPSHKKDLGYIKIKLPEDDILTDFKIFCYPDRIDEWLKTSTTLPVTFQIDPTNDCNQNCKDCSGNRYSNSSLSLEFMKDFTDQVSEFAKGFIFTGGGEPLCNESSIYAIVYAKDKGIEPALITNGSLITKEIAKILVENCTYVRVSIEYPNSMAYSLYRGVEESEFFKVWKNVELLTEARDKHNPSCTVGVGYLTNEENEEGMMEFAERGRFANVNYVQFRPFHYDKTYVVPTIEKCQKLFDNDDFRVIATKFKYESMKNPSSIEDKLTECFRDHFTSIVAADGKMYPCCYTRGLDNFAYGDLNEDSFIKIWNSDKRKQVFQDKLTLPDCPPMCREDKANQILWQIHKTCIEGSHVSFV